jgi:hypothetical protein
VKEKINLYLLTLRVLMHRVKSNPVKYREHSKADNPKYRKQDEWIRKEIWGFSRLQPIKGEDMGMVVATHTHTHTGKQPKKTQKKVYLGQMGAQGKYRAQIQQPSLLWESLVNSLQT